ncbi:hypothetical protein Taro_052985 [Colocasia esculenta]|uniref:Mediator of RNA polymerase II transcription subunit 33A n=1 Tax=Colocasia esculenta TaxID=4460 RepID=A0A843XL87_COLES|nr:hypothetical protein [Colocasia esculenta]
MPLRGPPLSSKNKNTVEALKRGHAGDAACWRPGNERKSGAGEAEPEEKTVMEVVKASEERGDPPLVWAVEVGRYVQARGLELPSVELGEVVVGNLCFAHNKPSLWKFLDQALASGLVSPLHALALLTARVVPHHQIQPEAYRLYLELLNRYALSFSSKGTSTCRERIAKSVSDALHLTQNYDIPNMDFGKVLMLFLFTAITRLIDCTLEDLGLQLTYSEKSGSMPVYTLNQDFHVKENSNDKRHEYREHLRKRNTLMAMEVAEKLTADTKAEVLLHLVYKNMYTLTFHHSLIPWFAMLHYTGCGTVGMDTLPNLLTVDGNLRGKECRFQRLEVGTTLEQQAEGGHRSCLAVEDTASRLYGLIVTNVNILARDRPERFNCLLQRLQLIEIQKSKSQGLILINHILVRLSANIQRTMDDKFQLNKRRAIGGLINVGSHASKFFTHHAASLPACWVPFDIFMENTMDGKHLYATSAVDILTELIKTLQVVNQAGWQETFQALWVSALRLVQREREPIEGPIPHLDARLCVLLSITPLAIVGVMKQEVTAQLLTKSDVAKDMEPDYKDSSEGSQCFKIKHGLTSSIQLLRQFNGLLSPPPSVVLAANNAARKAASFISNFKNGTKSCNSIDHGVASVEAVLQVGSMLHLIIEACIARKLIDTSVYFWPGYVVTLSLPMSPPPIQPSPWSTFMEGAQLTKTLTNALMVIPAPSVAEVEKLYQIALSGSEEERAAAAKILCGASLSRGWNIQEHVMQSVIKLLSTPVPSDFSHPGSHLFSYMSMISSILFGACHIDIVHIISVHGMVPDVAAALMPLCEAFGSMSIAWLGDGALLGLRDLVDFLPASLATIISYFSAEITRGIWKPVPMNGTEWPSPAVNLLSIEAEIKDILASAGVHVPTCYADGTTPVMLPLPMAALVSLTITFKLDKSLEYIHGVAGSAMENCTTTCAWPCMPIIGALWAQKVRRWHDFIVMSCARLPFERDQGAVRQLLRSCFTSFLGPSLNSGLRLTARGGVNGLLGHALSGPGARLSLAPGLLYLRSCRKFYDTYFVTDEILKLVIESARQLSSGSACGVPTRTSSGRVSLAAAAAAVKEAAILGASLLCIAGGVELVQVLYRETIPTWLLSARVETAAEEKGEGVADATTAGPASRILEGYAMAYMLVMSGAIVWGLDEGSTFWRVSAAWRSRAIRGHTDFVAGALEGKMSLGCDPATLKSYVSCMLGLMVQFTPAWVAEVEPTTLSKLAGGLRGWHECELALSLLEKGGPDAITFVVDAMS